MPGTSVQISSRCAPQLRGQVGRRGVRAAAPEQHGVAVVVAGDEALGDDDGRQRFELRLEGCVGGEVAGRREHAGALAPRRGALRAQHGARVGPGDVEALGAQEARAEVGRHQLTGRHDARAGAVAHLPHQRDPGGDLAQLGKVALDVLAQRATASSAARRRWRSSMARSSSSCAWPMRGIEQPLQAVGDAGDGRVHDQHARAGGAPRGHDPRRCCSSWRGTETLVPPNFRTIQAEGVRSLTQSLQAQVPGARRGRKHRRAYRLTAPERTVREPEAKARRRSLADLSRASCPPALPRAGSRRPCRACPGVRTRLSTRSSRRS